MNRVTQHNHFYGDLTERTLQAYEDTDLAPEEIISMHNDYSHMEKVVERQQNQNARLKKIIDSRDQQIATMKKALESTTNIKNDYFKQMQSYIKAFRLHQSALELMCSDLLSAYATSINPENIDLYTKKYVQQAQEQEGKS